MVFRPAQDPDATLVWGKTFLKDDICFCLLCLKIKVNLLSRHAGKGTKGKGSRPRAQRMRNQKLTFLSRLSGQSDTPF